MAQVISKFTFWLFFVLAFWGSVISGWMHFHVLWDMGFYVNLALLIAVLFECAKVGVVTSYRYFIKQKLRPLGVSLSGTLLFLRLGIFFVSWYLSGSFFAGQITSDTYSKYIFAPVFGLIFQFIIFIFYELFIHMNFDVLQAYHKLYTLKKQMGARLEIDSIKETMADYLDESVFVNSRQEVEKQIRIFNDLMERNQRRARVGKSRKASKYRRRETDVQ